MTDLTTTANQGGAAAEPAATPATETIVSAGTETEVAAAETPAEGATPDPAKPGEEAAKRTPWFQHRIAQKTAQASAATARAEAAERQRDMYRALAEGRTPPEGEAPPAATPEPVKPAAALSETDVERRATEIANARVRANEFSTACNRTFEAGKKDFADFETSRDSLVSNMGDAISPEFLQAVTAIPDGHKVFYALGKDLDEAARILALPPIPMALELARMANTPKGRALSNAPAPIKPIDGSTKPGFDPHAPASQEEFEKWFNKKRAERR